MKSQVFGEMPSACRDFTSRHPVRPGLNQQAESIEAVFLRECDQTSQCLRLFHISAFIEIIGLLANSFL